MRRSPPNKSRKARPSPLGEQLELHGEGPFTMALVQSVEMAVGKDLAVMEMTTVEGQVVKVPLEVRAVADLYELARQALEALGPQDGDTIQ